MKSYDSAKLAALQQLQQAQEPELVSHGPGFMSFEFPENTAARKVSRMSTEEPELVSESRDGMVFAFRDEDRGASVPRAPSSRVVTLEPTVIEGRRERMGIPGLEASSTIRRPSDDMAGADAPRPNAVTIDPVVVEGRRSEMGLPPAEPGGPSSRPSVTLEPTIIEGRRPEMGLADAAPEPEGGSQAAPSRRVTLEPTVIEGRPDQMSAKPPGSTETSVSGPDEKPKRIELRDIGSRLSSEPSELEMMRAAQEADARYRWFDEMRRAAVGVAGGRHAAETRPIEPTAVRDTTQAIQLQRAERERGAEEALRDPSSEESRRRQALLAQMLPDIPANVVEQVPGADIDSGVVLRNLGAYRAAAQEAAQRSAERGEERQFRATQQDDQQAFQQQQLEARNAQQAAMVELRNKLRRAGSVRGGGMVRVGSNEELLQAAVSAGIPEAAARNMRVRDLAGVVARDSVSDDNRDARRSERANAQEIAPGIRSSIALTDPEARTARIDISEASRGLGAIGEMRRIAREYGAASAITPEARQRIEAALMPLRALAAQTQGTGVINPSEAPIINAALANPASLGQTTFGTFTAAADQWERSIENRLRGGLRGLSVADDDIDAVIAQARGGVRGGGGGGNRGNAQRQETQSETVTVRAPDGTTRTIRAASLDAAHRAAAQRGITLEVVGARQ
jgi:hypothetical protein